MSQYAFGTGTLYAKSTANTLATPYEFGTLQDVSIDFSFSLKELFGQYTFARAIGRGTGKITGKAAVGQFNAQSFNDIFLPLGGVGGDPGVGATSLTAGTLRTVPDEPGVVTTKTVIVVNNTTFLRDLGVVYAGNGVALTKINVVSIPVGDQYSCNETTGNYQFNANLNGQPVLLSYQYTKGSVGKTVPLTNPLIGLAPEFMCVFSTTFGGKNFSVVLNACISSKLSLSTKIEDFTIPAFDFAAHADASNTVGSIFVDE